MNRLFIGYTFCLIWLGYLIGINALGAALYPLLILPVVVICIAIGTHKN